MTASDCKSIIMRSIYEDPLSGIYLALSGCFGAFGMFIRPDTPIGTVSLILQAIFIGLFIFRFIRMWKDKEYNPPTGWLPALKIIDAALWFIVIIMWWNEVNNSDQIVGIGIMIIMMIYGAKELYQAIKLIIMNRK